MSVLGLGSKDPAAHGCGGGRDSLATSSTGEESPGISADGNCGQCGVAAQTSQDRLGWLGWPRREATGVGPASGTAHHSAPPAAERPATRPTAEWRLKVTRPALWVKEPRCNPYTVSSLSFLIYKGASHNLEVIRLLEKGRNGSPSLAGLSAPGPPHRAPEHGAGHAGPAGGRVSFVGVGPGLRGRPLPP